MVSCLLYRDEPKSGRTRYYRVEIASTLFGDYSVIREWGAKGRKGRHLIRLFGNLREASTAADTWRNGALNRGYIRNDQDHKTAA